MIEEPLLGLATTRQLIAELKVRLEMTEMDELNNLEHRICAEARMYVTAIEAGLPTSVMNYATAKDLS